MGLIPRISWIEDGLRTSDQIGDNGKTIIKSQDRILNYESPAEGPLRYEFVGKNILKKGLKVPTGDDLIPLIYSAYFDKKDKGNPLFEDIREILSEGKNNCHLKNLFFHVYNKYIFASNGVYIQQDFEATANDKKLIKISNLENAIRGGKEIKGVKFSKSGHIRFVPRERCEFGENTTRHLAENGFVIGSYGISGAKQLAKISTQFSWGPIVGFEGDFPCEEDLFKVSESNHSGFGVIDGGSGCNLTISSSNLEYLEPYRGIANGFIPSKTS